MEFSIILILMTVLADDQPTAEQPRPDAAVCQVVLDGDHIEQLILEGDNGRTYVKDAANSNFFFEPGRYRLSRIMLKGGCFFDNPAEPEWFTLSPGEPYHLRAGAPLTSHVNVKREGQLLKLDYRLADAAGRHYRNTDRSSPPRFSIYQDGREIASDSFEYG
jgi:hypothetical protein